MKQLNDFVKRVIHHFLLIFASIIIIITLMRQWFNSGMAFDLKSIYIILAFSFVSALVGYMLPRMRRIFHFIILESILISVALITGIAGNVSSVLILAVQIALIYAIVLLLTWRSDKKVAARINEALQGMKDDKSGEL